MNGGESGDGAFHCMAYLAWIAHRNLARQEAFGEIGMKTEKAAWRSS
jgi:hypothetical protein